MMNENRKLFTVLLITAMTAGIILSGCTATPEVGTIKQEKAPSSSKSTDQAVTKTAPGKIEGYEIYENNDPFQPKIGPGSSTTVTTTTTTTSTGTTTTTSSATLLSVATDLSSATILVDGNTYSNIAQGATFATNYRLLSISAGSVVVMYGDNQYTLYLGQAMTVK